MKLQFLLVTETLITLLSILFYSSIIFTSSNNLLLNHDPYITVISSFCIAATSLSLILYLINYRFWDSRHLLPEMILRMAIPMLNFVVIIGFVVGYSNWLRFNYNPNSVTIAIVFTLIIAPLTLIGSYAFNIKNKIGLMWFLICGGSICNYFTIIFILCEHGIYLPVVIWILEKLAIAALVIGHTYYFF